MVPGPLNPLTHSRSQLSMLRRALEARRTRARLARYLLAHSERAARELTLGSHRSALRGYRRWRERPEVAGGEAGARGQREDGEKTTRQGELRHTVVASWC